MNVLSRKLTLLGVAVSILSMSFTGVASAHVVVRPAEVVTAGFQTFTVGVPNERDISTTDIKVVMPSGLNFVSPTQKAGWQIDVEKDGSGEKATVKSITWSGNEIAAGFRDDFTFSVQVPDEATALQWKAYQTYSDGTVVAWDKAGEAAESNNKDPNSGPLSVTKVVAETESTSATNKIDQTAVNAQTAADRALYIGIAALIISLVGVYLVTRKKL